MVHGLWLFAPKHNSLGRNEWSWKLINFGHTISEKLKSSNSLLGKWKKNLSGTERGGAATSVPPKSAPVQKLVLENDNKYWQDWSRVLFKRSSKGRMKINF